MTLLPEPVIVHYFLQLPVEIIRSIFNEYLKGSSKYALLQTTRQFNPLRKQIIYIKLKKNNIQQQFYLNHEYLERVLSCIENPQRQLHLVLECYRKESIDLSVILPVHKLSIYTTSVIINFYLIGTYKPSLLEISSCVSSIDIEHCKGISTLVLTNCKNIENIDKFSDIKVCKLRSCSVNPVDWSIFSSLQVFELTKCLTIIDVSAFARIPDLTLDQCPNITNIDVLTHNKKLTINYCEGIEKISLSDHPRDEICIKNSSTSLDLSIGGKVRKLKLFYLRLLKITLHGDVNKLVIEDDDLLSINYLPVHSPVHSLSLIRCVNLEEIPSSLLVKSLEINGCCSLTSIRSLKYLESLVVYSASELESIEDLPLLRSLEIDDCENLARLINLPLCESCNMHLFYGELEVVNCPGYIKRDLNDF